MLDKDSSLLLHLSQNAALVVLSILCLPFSTFVLLISYAVDTLVPHDGLRKRIRGSPGFKPKTVLVTGVGMAKGLRIARSFYETGHRVIGADFEPSGAPVSGRVSKALSKFYRLELPSDEKGTATYIQGLLHAIVTENVDLWVSCSGVASAAEDGQAKEVIERKTRCRCVQYDVRTTSMLHEKDTFIRHTESLGLPAPETHELRSRDAVHRVLNEAKTKEKQYVMKPVGVDDVSRANIMTPLPRRTMSQTYNHISNLKISETYPWVLQQYIKGKEYCTHAIVVNGLVKVFVACPSAELLMHYVALPQDSGLSKAMLLFTKEFASRSGPGFTGHLSFDFLVEETTTERGVERRILPIECNPRAHTAVVLFAGNRGAMDMTKAYLSALNPAVNGVHLKLESSNSSGTRYPEAIEAEFIPYALPRVRGYYWIGHDLVTLVLHPLFRYVMSRQLSRRELFGGFAEFSEHLLFWKDGSFELWDPLPWWWLYHIYWPGQFLHAMWKRKKWSRINVSTTKIFAC